MSRKQERVLHSMARRGQLEQYKVGEGEFKEHLLNLHLRDGQIDLEPPLFPNQINSTTAVPRTGFTSKFTTDSLYLIRVDLTGIVELEQQLDDAIDRVQFMHQMQEGDIRNDPKVATGEHCYMSMSHAELERLVDHTVLLGTEGPIMTIDDRKVLTATMITKALAKDPKLKPRIMETMKEAYLDHRRDIKKVRSERDQLVHLFHTYDELEDLCTRDLVLQRPDGSALTKFVEYTRDHDLVIPLRVEHADLDATVSARFKNADQAHSFVVEHDWSGVLSKAEIVGEGSGEIEMPFPLTCFEFVVSRHRLLALVMSPNDKNPFHGMSLIMRFGDDWAFLCNYKLSDNWQAVPHVDVPASPAIALMQPLADLIAKNIRAIAILLETKIVEREVVRVDAKLNRAREKRGKLPLHDYHVVSLSKRERVKPRLPDELDPDREITRKRWHLVRSHWRQYANHRTRIPWHSRGNIELGIIDKHYKL